MADLTKSNLYKITAWRDNSVKIVLTVGEGSNAANPTYNKSINFRLYEPGKDTLTIPDSGVDITLAIERPDGETDIIAGTESGIDTVMVLTGVSTPDTPKNYAYQPTEVLNGVGDIVGSHSVQDSFMFLNMYFKLNFNPISSIITYGFEIERYGDY